MIGWDERSEVYDERQRRFNAFLFGAMAAAGLFPFLGFDGGFWRTFISFLEVCIIGGAVRYAIYRRQAHLIAQRRAKRCGRSTKTR